MCVSLKLVRIWSLFQSRRSVFLSHPKYQECIRDHRSGPRGFWCDHSLYDDHSLYKCIIICDPSLYNKCVIMICTCTKTAHLLLWGDFLSYKMCIMYRLVVRC